MQVNFAYCLLLAATDALSQEACGPLYSSNTTLGSAVSSAIASATPIAIAATAGKDPTDVSNYPPCAVSRSLFVLSQLLEKDTDPR